jgi:hypothetical protein
MRRVWQRKIPFTGSKAEWESGRKQKVMENSSLHSEGFFNSGGPIVDLPGAEKDTAGVHVAWGAVHGEGEDANAVDDPWGNTGSGEDGATAAADAWGATTAAVDDGWGSGATASGGDAWGKFHMMSDVFSQTLICDWSPCDKRSLGSTGRRYKHTEGR